MSTTWYYWWKSRPGEIQRRKCLTGDAEYERPIFNYYGRDRHGQWERCQRRVPETVEYNDYLHGSMCFSEATDFLLQEIVAELFDQLPQDYREVLTLRYEEDLHFVDIAERLNLRISTVQVRLYRGRQMLRENLLRSIGQEAFEVATLANTIDS